MNTQHWQYQNYRPVGCGQCRACGWVGQAHVVDKISVAGWVTFAVLLVCFFPLFWVGLLIKDRRYQCPACLAVQS